MIKLKNVSVSYPSSVISFKDNSIQHNKVTFVTGKNGTGKTTLLKAIGSLIEYDGVIKTDGFVTYSSQEPIVFRMSVLDNILYPLRIRNLDVNMYMDKVNEYSKYLELDKIFNQDASKISSGEKMKVTIIRSIIFNPDYVLLDEPTTHLDVESIDALIQLIKQLKDTITFVIVSHNQWFMDQLKDIELKLGDY